MSKSCLFKTIAIIPVYDDDGKLLKVLKKFEENLVNEICIVIDAASKKSLREIRETAVPVPICLIKNRNRRGIGYAIKQGLHYATDRRYSLAVILAGNNKDDPREIPRLLKPITEQGYDYVQGSRFLPGGESINNPHLRGFFCRFYPYVWTLLTKVRCTDVTNGFRAYKLKLFDDKRINIEQEWLNGYQLEYYLHFKVLTLNYKMTEVPVSKAYAYRYKGGYSKISPFRDWWKIVGPLIYLYFRIKY